ncbi:DUF983 domain-containing protein [Cellulophaga omnivescoria]|uniref:DUF983 domain-containing protein n=1 Tax=Cellulophaga omnivescoria TaxID=1888890 RepID=UPI000985E4C2|nr:DUF983 domain-containing protein [Cellulophaga omnivescoria]WBU90772.1 DUF983 domain-containing protein [Cellulophaga omnivescoria]
MASLVSSLLKGKCPQCKKRNIFNAAQGLFLLSIPEMDAVCKNCNFKFEKEPGFFFGAMFVSYALAVAEFIAFSILFYFILKMPILYTFFGVLFFALILSTFNYRYSRIIWIYLFYKEKKA